MQGRVNITLHFCDAFAYNIFKQFYLRILCRNMLIFSTCVSTAACTNHVPVITTLLRGGESPVVGFFFQFFMRACVHVAHTVSHIKRFSIQDNL